MGSMTSFGIFIEVVKAFTPWLWPIVAIVALVLLRRDISGVLHRIRKGKFIGQEVELDPELVELRRTVEEAQEEIVDVRSISQAAAGEKDETERDVQQILTLAASDPRLGVMKLSSTLENEVRSLAGSLGQAGSRRPVSLHALYMQLVSKGYLPKHTSESLNLFWRLRNEVVHGRGQNIDDQSIKRLLDVGLDLLKTVRAIPHEVNIVYHPGVDLFTDPECKMLIPGAKGIVLETTPPGGEKKIKRIFPTTKIEYYERGKAVSWEWSFARMFERTWYRHPDTNEIEKGWDSSATFVGRHLEDV